MYLNPNLNLTLDLNQLQQHRALQLPRTSHIQLPFPRLCIRQNLLNLRSYSLQT